jgi:hypothetical protein
MPPMNSYRVRRHHRLALVELLSVSIVWKEGGARRKNAES